MSNLKSAMQDMEAVFGMKPGALQKAIADDIAHRAATTERNLQPQASPGEVERMVDVTKGSATGRGTAGSA